MKRFFTYFASVCLSGYFIIFGFLFLFYPALVESFGLKWINPAGITEVRVYYGAFSIGAGVFILYLILKRHLLYSLVGGVFFSSCVFFSRIIFITIDKAWGEKYTLLAVPAEFSFVVLLTLFYLIEKRYQKENIVLPVKKIFQINQINSKKTLNILFICSSNVCRSPWCEYQFKRMLKGNSIKYEVSSSAVFNRSKVIHPMTEKALINDGFTKDEVLSHQPSFIKDDKERFERAHLIIGMSKAHGLLLPKQFRGKYLPLSQAAGLEYQPIEDPFLIRNDKKYSKVMDRLTYYLQGFLDQLSLNESGFVSKNSLIID